ncbi:MAG: peptidylprolyl isomerase [Planctomycetes bacterium]|nr:peptidylprolyl isomerase [Planctomycetota bacterium]
MTTLALSILCVTTGTFQLLAGEPSESIQALRPELAADRPLFYPSQPIAVRFTLFNPTDEPVELPVVRSAEAPDGITLPRSLIIGNSAQPALSIAYENERPVPIQPGAGDAEQGPEEVLRLAPRASVGAEVDLCELHRQLRYSGNYRLEWQPLGGSVEPVSLSFRVETRKDAVLVTDYGKITFSLLYDRAPRNISNFLELVRTRFYDGKAIHRVVPHFIIQGGSPDGTGKGTRPDGKLVPAEFHDRPLEPGTLAMARKPSDPHSASCQFFVSLARLPELDGKYTVIGQARGEESLRTLQILSELPTNAQGRPTRPLAIRFFTLVDVLEADVQQLEMSRP